MHWVWKDCDLLYNKVLSQYALHSLEWNKIVWEPRNSFSTVSPVIGVITKNTGAFFRLLEIELADLDFSYMTTHQYFPSLAGGTSQYVSCLSRPQRPWRISIRKSSDTGQTPAHFSSHDSSGTLKTVGWLKRTKNRAWISMSVVLNFCPLLRIRFTTLSYILRFQCLPAVAGVVQNSAHGSLNEGRNITSIPLLQTTHRRRTNTQVSHSQPTKNAMPTSCGASLYPTVRTGQWSFKGSHQACTGLSRPSCHENFMRNWISKVEKKFAWSLLRFERPLQNWLRLLSQEFKEVVLKTHRAFWHYHIYLKLGLADLFRVW